MVGTATCPSRKRTSLISSLPRVKAVPTKERGEAKEKGAGRKAWVLKKSLWLHVPNERFTSRLID